MLLLAGSVPYEVGKVFTGKAVYKPGWIRVGKSCLPINRGTAAFVAAAAIVCRTVGIEEPNVILAGDIGQKASSRLIYDSLNDFLKKTGVRVLTLHYLMPNILYHKRLISTIKKINPRPVLIADAGSMYVAKAAGQASLYELFTPDLGELAFLADDKAVHPAYTRGFICHLEGEVPALIKRAYAYKNAAAYLCVKGAIDYICHNGSILGKVDEPSVDVLESIGGTGDTLTGIASALIYKGMEIDKACILAAKVNRLAGKLANPTPATQVSEIIGYIPQALKSVTSSFTR